MVKVNPPPHIPIPSTIKNDPGLLSWSQSIERVLFQLYSRSGAGGDTVAETQERVDDLEFTSYQNESGVNTLSAKTTQLEKQDELLSAKDAELENQDQLLGLVDEDLFVLLYQEISTLRSQVNSLRLRLEDLEL